MMGSPSMNTSSVVQALSSWGVVTLLVIGVVGLAAYYAIGRSRGRYVPQSRRREGSIVIPVGVIDFFYWSLNGIAQRLGHLGVRPNHITVASLVLSLAAGCALAFGAFGWGAAAFALAASGDALDGLVARHTHSGSPAGAFLDSSLDRLSEAAVLTGLAIWGAGGPMTWLAFWALVASFTISYLRARGHALGFDCPAGLMQRPERLAILVVAMVASVPVAALVEPSAIQPVYHTVLVALVLIGVLSTWTAFDRGRRIYRELSRRVSV
jgi:phosphatidylglycerophosphate synthase